MKKIVVIGGSAAGAKAAAKARRLDEFATITIIQRDPDLSMASCGYPYYVGGLFDNRDMLLATPTGVVRDPLFFKKAKGIEALVETEVSSIDRVNKKVVCNNIRTSEEQTLPYDKLIIATGARPTLPPLANIDLQGITTLLTMGDTDYLKKICKDNKGGKAVVIGGGLIGVETCEALRLSGMEVTIIEMADQLLPFLDWQMAKLVENHMKSKGVTICTGERISGFRGEDGHLCGVQLDEGAMIDCELAVIATGVRPNSQLAEDTGLKTGLLGGIKVDQYMQTSDPHIYAAGDCVEIRDRSNGDPTFSPMGDLANLEGRVAGENAIAGNSVTFPGTYHTGICKVFDFAAGSTGLSENKAKQKGMKNYQVVVNASPDKPGFMGAGLLVSKLLISTDDQRILGYQCVGPGDVSRQVAMAAMALQGKMTLQDLINADLPYAPPFSLAVDHLICSAHIMENKVKQRMVGISAEKVQKKIAEGEEIFFLDGRSPEEYEEMHLGIGEKLIPMGALRSRLDEFPQDKQQLIICFCKISLRGYEAARILMAHGYTNVQVMEGGIMAWPYPRKK